MKDPEIIKLEKVIAKLESSVQAQGAIIASLQNTIRMLDNKLTSAERRLRTEINSVRASKQ